MQQLRAKLTRLKSKIEERLPNEADLLGYQGISREGLIEYVDETYGLTQKIEELRGGFNLVVLRRKVDPRFEYCKEFLNDIMGTKEAPEKFDRFLNALTAIHDEVFLTYVIYCSEGVRTEAEVARAIEALQAAQANYQAIQPQAEEALAKVTALKEQTDQIFTWHESVEDAQIDTSSFREIAKNAADAASASLVVTTKLEEEVRGKALALGQLASNAGSNEKRLESLLRRAAAELRLVDALKGEIEALRLRTIEQSDSIETTLRLASKHGMASSFRERKKELGLPLILWAGGFALAMGLLVYLGVTYILPKAEVGNPGDIGHLLVRVSLVAPVIWLGWMSAKQYGYVSRIREDYSFKYASALAFEGYKKEATSGHPEVLEDLLKVATENMALNPLRIYGDEPQAASPLQELITSALRSSDAKSIGAEIKEAALGVLKKKVGGAGES